MKTNYNQAIPTLGIEHPGHSIPEVIAENLLSIQEANLTAQKRQNEIAQLARPTKEERKAISELKDSGTTIRNSKPELIQKIRDLQLSRTDRVREFITREVDPQRTITLPDFDPRPPQPGPTDPTFWWARTDWWNPAHFNVGMYADGLHFSGGVTTHDGNLHYDSLGAVALFELQPDRIPMSLSRRWISTPHIELIGGLTAYTGDNDIFTGDLWSKCWMHLDQQVYQIGFGEKGPVNIILGQAHEEQNLIFEENKDRHLHIGLPGFKLMPAVAFSNINPTSSIWVRLEIRFDIQTEGAGTLLWLDPEVLLRTFQWPLAVL